MARNEKELTTEEILLVEDIKDIENDKLRYA